MKPIRLTTIGKIIWTFIILIGIFVLMAIISLLKKEEPKKTDDPETVDTEKIIDYTDSKNYLYDFDSKETISKSNVITIDSSGTYKLKGHNDKYRFIVDSENSIIKFIFSNFTTSQIDNLINIKKANKVIIELEDGSTNKIVSDAIETEKTKKMVIIKTKANLDIIGNGKLIVDSTGTLIRSDESVNIKNATLEINNINSGIDIKGNFKIEDGTTYILANEQGLYSDGNINIENSTFVIRTEGIALKNKGLFIINSGKVFIASGEEIQKPNANSLQKSLILNFAEPRKKILILHDTSQIVLAYAGGLEYSHILYSDEFKSDSYVIYGNGKLAGTQTYGLYKVEDSEESSQMTCEGLENDRFLISELVNIYDDVVKK